MKKPVVHFEIGCSDIPKTVDFYQKIFDWNIVAHGNTAAVDTGVPDAIPGHINKLGPEDPQQYITFYIETDTIEQDLAAIVENGGEIFVGPLPLPDGRSFAWFHDVAGNKVGLITPSGSES